jgi:hypothetical protein
MHNDMSYWSVQYLLPIYLAHFGSVFDYASIDHSASANHHTTPYHRSAIYYFFPSR